LENSGGERLDLNGKTGIYFTDPTGLGFTLTPSIADLKFGFFRPVSSDSEPQNSVTGTLTFVGAIPYAKYQNFVDWVAIAGQLLLIYSPVDGVEYYRQIDIGYLSKTEINSVGALEIAASFNCLTPWYLATATELALDNSAGNAIRYTYRYTNTLVYGADSAATLAGTISPGGHVPASVLMRYYGAILNPKIRLVGITSGETFGICSVGASIESGEILELSTLYRDSHVYKISANGTITDLLDYISLESDPFFRVPIDEPCTLTVEADSVFSGNADLSVYYYFRSV
jgi:hypothetical protein